MIFKTTTNKYGTKININSDIYNDIFSKKIKVSNSDIKSIIAYNNEFNRLSDKVKQNNINVSNYTIAQKAANKTMTNASIAAQNIVANTKNGTVALNTLTTTSKAATIGMKALATAGNLFLFLGISKLIELAADAIDKYAHRIEYAENELEEATSQFDNSSNELQIMYEKLDTCKIKLEELKRLSENGSISLIEENELKNLKEQNDELERKIALKKAENIKDQENVLEKNQEKLNTTIESKYEKMTIMAGASQVEVAKPVTIPEEFGNALTHYDSLKHMLENGSISKKKYNKEIKKTKQDIDKYSKSINKSVEAYDKLKAEGIELQGDDFKQYSILKKLQDRYLKYNYTLYNTTESYLALSDEDKKDIITDKLEKNGLSKKDSESIYNQLTEEQKDKFYEVEFNFKEPTQNDYQSAEEYGKAYIDTMYDSAKDEEETLSEQLSLTSPLSFQESWDSLGTTGNDDTKQATLEAKEQLLELAEAGKLTTEELKKSPAGKTIIEQTKLSAEEATEAVNKLADKTSQLSNMKSGIQSISSVLAQKQEYQKNPETRTTGIDSSTLSGFDASIKGLNSWKQFEETLGNGKSSMEDCQQAANKLATEWVNSNNFLSQLDDTNKNYYISQLKGMGIQNAEAIVTETLANKTRELNAEKQWSKATTTSLANATVGEINNLASLNGWSKQTKNTLYALALQKNLLNGTTLDFSSDINGIIEFVEKLGYSAEAMKTYQTVRAGENGSAGMPSNVSEGYYGKKAQKEINRILKKLKKSSKIKIDPSSDVKEIDENNSNDGNNKTKETKQSFDWLERKVTVLTNKLDLLKAKIENVFSVRAKNSIINDEIKKTNALINTYKKQEKKYKAQAKKSAKSQKTATNEEEAKLTGKKGKQLKKQIQTGQIKGSKKQWIDAYGESTANAIEEYQNYWDKYQTAKKKQTGCHQKQTGIKNPKTPELGGLL